MGWTKVEDGLPKEDRTPCWVTRYSVFHDSFYTDSELWYKGRFTWYPLSIVAWMPKSESESKPEPCEIDRSKIVNEDWDEFVSHSVSINDMKKVIKPCPKCGSTDIDITLYEGAQSVFDYRYGYTKAVRCLKCGCRTEPHFYESYAFVDWQKGKVQ